jgi:hypothetical protein
MQSGRLFRKNAMEKFDAIISICLCKTVFLRMFPGELAEADRIQTYAVMMRSEASNRLGIRTINDLSNYLNAN